MPDCHRMQHCGSARLTPKPCICHRSATESTLINGQGFYGDCQLNPVVNGTQGAASLPCNLTAVTVLPDESVQQPWASAANPGMEGCSWDFMAKVSLRVMGQDHLNAQRSQPGSDVTVTVTCVLRMLMPSI